MRSSALLACCLLLAAGCLATEEPNSRSPGSQSATERFELPETLYLDADTRLRGDAPTDQEAEGVPVGSFYTAWAEGAEQPTWTGPALSSPARVTNATLTFYYTAETTVATTGPQDQGFPEFVVYLGTEQAPMGWASLQGPDVVQQGDQVEITGELSLPAGGLVYRTGDAPVVKIAPVQAQGDEGSRLIILVDGAEAPSRVDMDVEPVTLPGWTPGTPIQHDGTLAGSAYATGPQEGTTAASFPVDLRPGHAGIIVDLERATGAGIADIDLELIGPDGVVVARSVTPEDDEGLALFAPNVEAIGHGTWTLRVVNYGNVAVQFELTGNVLDELAGT